MRKLLLTLLPLITLLTGCTRLPEGLRIIESPDSCLPDHSYCATSGASAYQPRTRTVILGPNWTLQVLAHELCHARQHQVVLDSLHKEPSDSLQEYLMTAEGQDYLRMGGSAPAGMPLEGAANACAWWYLDKNNLTPAELAWAEKWLGR
jgi:hypothetical protein